MKLVNLVGEVTYVPCSDKLTVLPTYQMVCSFFIDRRVRIEKSTLILTIRDVDSRIMLPYSLSVCGNKNCFELKSVSIRTAGNEKPVWPMVINFLFLQVFNFRNASIYLIRCSRLFANLMALRHCPLGIFDVQGSLLT